MFRRGGSIALAVFCACAALAKKTDMEVLNSQPTRCTYEYAYDMYGAYCAGLRLSKIPSLSGSIEILEFSENKLREIRSDTFSSYTSIKFLYLSENLIYRIDDDAFVYLTYLQTLDLSENAISSLSPTLLQLPSLRKLNLRGNPLGFHMDLTLDSLASNKQIRSPLEHFDISDCKVDILPEWGLLPHLQVYNISNNPLISLEVKHFSVMCNLRQLDMSKAIDSIRLCDLRPPVTWFQEKNVHFQLEKEEYTRLNSIEFEKCRNPDVAAAYNTTFQQCKSEYKEYMQGANSRVSRRTWLTIIGGLAGFLVGFILLLYLMHRHNVRQTKNAAKKMNSKIKSAEGGDQNAKAVLLINVS